MALDNMTCAGIVSEYTLSQDGFGHLSKDSDTYPRIRPAGLGQSRGTIGRYQNTTSRQSGDRRVRSKVKDQRLASIKSRASST